MTKPALQSTKIQPGKIIATLGAMKNSLSRASQRIANFILQHPERLPQLSIAGLAQKTMAGEASIIRFCRTLGYRGFQDFKMDLAIELARNETDSSPLLDANVTTSDDMHTIGLKLQNVVNGVLSETLSLLDSQQVTSVVQALLSCEAIYLFGVGSSGITAADMKNKLMRIGMRVDAVTNNHFMYMQATLLQKNDVAIGISHSGYSKETVQALKLARQAGATTVALTHNLGSPLLKQADYHLINGNHHQGMLQGDSFGTKTAQLFVLDLIYTMLVQARPEQSRANKLRTTNAVKLTSSTP